MQKELEIKKQARKYLDLENNVIWIEKESKLKALAI